MRTPLLGGGLAVLGGGLAVPGSGLAVPGSSVGGPASGVALDLPGLSLVCAVADRRGQVASRCLLVAPVRRLVSLAGVPIGLVGGTIVVAGHAAMISLARRQAYGRPGMEGRLVERADRRRRAPDCRA